MNIQEISKLPSPFREEDLHPVVIDREIKEFLSYTKKKLSTKIISRDTACKTA